MFDIKPAPFVSAPIRNREPTASATNVALMDETIKPSASYALNFTGFMQTAVPAGSHGRIRIHGSDATKLAEANAPTTAIKLNVATWAPDRTEVPLPMDKAVITSGCEALARAGYNAIRLHGLEYWLMDSTVGAFNFPTDRLDCFDWFLCELKRLGLFWIFNPRQPELWQDGQGAGRFTMPASAVLMKPRLFVQQSARDHWTAGFGLLFNRTNKYTGMNMLQDPALFQVECMNECSAQFVSSASWPATWTVRESAQGTAGLTWSEWLATQYANIAALNTQYGTAFADFPSVTPVTGTSLATLPATQEGIDALLYCVYLNSNLAAWFKTALTAMGYTGLMSTVIDFPSIMTAKTCKNGPTDLVNLHSYPMLAHFPSDMSLSAQNTPLWGSTTNPGYTSWALPTGAYADGKPVYPGEFGWPQWAGYRNQYPMQAAYNALNGVVGHTCFHQGNFFDTVYNTNSKFRLRALYSYSGQGDPVAKFAEVASMFAMRYVADETFTQTLPVTDRYSGINLDGTSPRTPGRASRAVQNLFLSTQLMPSVVKTRLAYGTDNTDDALNAIWNAKTWFQMLDDLKTAGAFDSTNEGWISANTNHGTISAVTTTGSVVGGIATVTASLTQPVLTLGANTTLADNDHVSIATLNGSTGTWPGTNNKGTRAYVKVVSLNQIQILSGLNLTGLSGFTDGTWSEFDNVSQSASKQVRMSRRDKCAHIDTAKFKFFCNTTATFPYSKVTGLTVTALSNDSALFVAALDDTAIATSRHLLIGLVGNTENTGQAYTDATRVTLTSFGDYPILTTDVTAAIAVALTSPQDFALYRLNRDGTRSSRETPTSIDAGAGTLLIALRTGSISPSIFFELVR